MSKNKQYRLAMNSDSSEIRFNSIKITKNFKDTITTLLNFEIGVKKSLFSDSSFPMLQFYDNVSHTMIVQPMPSMDASEVSESLGISIDRLKEVITDSKKYKRMIKKLPVNKYIAIDDNSNFGVNFALDLIDYSHDFLNMFGQELAGIYPQTVNSIKKLVNDLRLLINNYKNQVLAN